MIPYPAFRFGPDNTSVVVLSPEEDSLLDEQWSDKPPEVFDAKTAPTYGNVNMIPRKIDVDAIAEVIKRKPGRPPKES